MSALATRNGATDLDKSSIDYEAIQDPGEGHSIAGWTGTTIMLIGTIVGVIGNLIFSWPVFWAGAIILVVGFVLGNILSKAGLGAKPHHHTLNR
ncbi:hypothetical protein NQ038_10820 [Brevibacterium sp. 50QC2O2]|nr:MULTISPECIES: HGxxPAAW family protein [unclassified Brevibacterium]MCQ9366862.1 hypothetical protein [Brevibacterium sp. 91QC2O2]MCQ9384012.1 hypothetical protein [Brevibacterium sp. 68QC2CO]MCQ9389134.1 hypothetical protein [Brevibacterium sp. 50QC2O2]